MKLTEIIYKLIGDKKYNQILSIRYYHKVLKKYRNKKKIIYMLSPTHGNLGDQAIALASKKYLSDNFKEYDIVEINCENTYKYSKWIKKIIKKNDLIFLHGGGNMGNHYIYEEEARRYIIKNFKNNKIISFTQTMYFSKDKEGMIELKKSKKIYNKHNNLILIAREEESYKNMKKQFTNAKILLCPDIVLYLNEKINNLSFLKREFIMTCLRNDKERYISNETKKELINLLKDNYDNVIESDTIIKDKVTNKIREDKLFDLWEKFSKSKLVVTDRLHGMVF